MSRARCNHYFSGREVRIWRPESVSILRSAKTIVLQGCDVINRLRNASVMAGKRFSRGREKLSVAGGRFVMSFKDRICTCNNYQLLFEMERIKEERRLILSV